MYEGITVVFTFSDVFKHAEVSRFPSDVMLKSLGHWKVSVRLDNSILSQRCKFPSRLNCRLARGGLGWTQLFIVWLNCQRNILRLFSLFVQRSQKKRCSQTASNERSKMLFIVLDLVSVAWRQQVKTEMFYQVMPIICLGGERDFY